MVRSSSRFHWNSMMCHFRKRSRMPLALCWSAQLTMWWAMLAAIVLAALITRLHASSTQGVTAELISIWESRAWHNESAQFKLVSVSTLVLRLHGIELRDATA